MNTTTDLIELVHQLVEAENESGDSGKAKADLILAQNFTVITRSSGDEEDRDDLLKAIANPKNPNLLREPDEREFRVLESGDLGVVWSLITTKEQSDLNTILGRFRNIHVFENQERQWRLVAWQVTKLLEKPDLARP
jgi:hypothetical protein